MVSLTSLFWVFVIFFALIGALRGWAKEIVATAGLVLSLFVLKQFGYILLDTVGTTIDPTSFTGDPNVIYRRQFWILTCIHLFIMFFSYQGPSFTLGNRLQRRDNVQDKLLGAILGGVNGYFMMGTILSFLEYRPTAAGFTRLPANVGYPFAATTVIRPVGAAEVSLFNYLPFELLSGPILPLLMVALFLVVLIAII